MKKIQELKKIVNFYVLANKLKTTIIDEDNNYSISDHLFGSITIAISLNSEFEYSIRDFSKRFNKSVLLDKLVNMSFTCLSNLYSSFFEQK